MTEKSTQNINADYLTNNMLPAEIVLAPSWWHQHVGLTFDEDFFFDPRRRVEDERRMEQALYERWGKHGLGSDRDKDLPQVGAVHLAAGFMVSEMLGCEVRYSEDAPPQVVCQNMSDLEIDVDAAFESPVFKRFSALVESLKAQYGYVVGDVNFAGVLNLALDLRGEQFFLDLFDQPQKRSEFLKNIQTVITRFTDYIYQQTRTTSISVNRLVRHFNKPVFLHSECSHTMLSEKDYSSYLLAIDKQWSQQDQTFGIHYCGSDPHRHAETFALIPHLAFLDVGWGGDVSVLRKNLPDTFLSIRLNPVEIIHQTPGQISEVITRLVEISQNPYLTGVCCVNMDADVKDEQIAAIFETVEGLRKQ